MADCLSILRQHCIANKLKEIQETDEHIIIGEFAWPRTAKTNYLVYGKGRESEKKEYYTLVALVFLLKNVSLPHTQYVRQAGAANVQPVSLPDRKVLLDYLNGRIESSDSIDKSAPPEIPLQKPAVVKRSDDVSHAKKSRLDLEDEELLIDKQRWANKLDAPKIPASKTSLIDTINLKDSALSQAMSLERIAELKAKRIAIKRTTIKADDDIGQELGAVRSYVQLDIDATRDILSRERIWRTRKTVLESASKEFWKNISGLLHSVKVRETNPSAADAKRPATSSMDGSAFLPKTPQLPKAPAQVAYSRFDQERFTKNREITDQGFMIDTLGTYHGQSLRKVAEDPTPVVPVLPESRTATANAALTPAIVALSHKRTSKTPIIIIPAAPNSLITLYNVRDLLQDLRYVSSDERRSQGARRDNEVLIQRTKEGGLTVPYRVIDCISRLQPQDWYRVVAVFVHGPAWQFKGWPWNGNPVEIFSKIRAFHLKWSELPLDANVKNWSVKVLPLDRNKRHLDRSVVNQFWEDLDRFMLKCKPDLRR